MKQITITTAKATIIVCRLPENAYAVHVLNPMDHKPIIGWTDKVTLTPEYYGLPEGSWQLLGKASELTEEQCAEIAQYLIAKKTNDVLTPTHYMNYANDNLLCKTSVDSFSSLLSANGVLLSNPLGEEPKSENYVESLSFYADKFNWQAAEEKVWRNPYVLIFTSSASRAFS